MRERVQTQRRREKQILLILISQLLELKAGILQEEQGTHCADCLLKRPLRSVEAFPRSSMEHDAFLEITVSLSLSLREVAHLLDGLEAILHMYSICSMHQNKIIDYFHPTNSLIILKTECCSYPSQHFSKKKQVSACTA